MGGAGVVTLVTGIAVSIGFALLFLTQFGTSAGTTSSAYTAISAIITAINNNVVWVGLIMLAGLGGFAYALARYYGIV